MKNKFLFSVFFFILAFSFAGIVSADQIVNRNDGMVCDKHGSSAGCVGGVWIGDESYQGYLGHVSILAQGYGALGPAGGKYGVDVCLNDSSVMWTGACKNMVNSNTSGNIGDGQGLINDDLYIGDDPGPVIKYFVVSIYVNDAGTSGYAQIYGRKVTFDDFQPAAGADIKVGNQTDVTWATSGSIPGNPPSLSWSGPINCDQSGSVGASGGTTCTGLSAGTGQVSMTVTGYSGNGPITISKSTNINVSTVSTQTPKYRCSGGGSCMRDDVYGDTTDSNCNNSCSAGSAPVVTLNASPSTVSSGGSSTLSWNITGTVTSCNASGGWTTPGTLSGTRSTGPLSATTAYGLSCSGPGGVGTANTTVTVNPSSNPSITLLGWGPPSVLSSAPVAGSLNITYGAMGGLVWNGQNVNNCKIYRADGSLAGSFPKDGNAPVGPITSNQAHTIICDADNGSGQVQSTFAHNTAAPSSVNIKGWGPPDNVVTDGPVNITQGSIGAVTWTTTNAVYCELYQNGLFTGHTQVSPPSIGVGPINSTTSYQINCTNGVGTDISSDTIVFIPISTPSIDLTAGSVSPSSATVGTPVTFSGIVSNNGGSSTGASFNNVFQVWLSGNGAPTVVSVNSLSALAGGAARTVNSSSYTFSTPGTHSVRLCADLDSSMSGSIPESDENNNCGPWSTITVSNFAAPSVSILGWGPPSVPQSAPIAGSLNITYGAMGGLVWTSSNVNYCEIYRDGVRIGPFNANGGSAGVGPITSSQTHTIVCSGTDGVTQVQSSFSHNTSGPSSVNLKGWGPPANSVTDGPVSITQGSTGGVSWTSTNASYCELYQNGAFTNQTGTSRSAVGVGPINGATTYQVNCTDGVSNVSDTVVFNTLAVANPDLAAGGVSPSSATAGIPLLFTGSISNIGAGSTGAGFNNLFQVANASNGGGTVSVVSVNSSPALNGGASGNVTSSSFTFPSAGTYSVRVCADNDAYFNDTISESNEGNNCGGWTNVTVSNPVGAPTVSISALPTSVVTNGSSTLTWNVGGQATSCSASGGWSGAKSTSGGNQLIGSITTDTTYTITCVGPGGTAVDSVTVTVTDPPSVSLSASPTSIGTGGSSNLTWTTSGNITSCSASGGWSGAKSVSGGSQSTGSISSATTYNITCTGPGGTSSDSVTVSITPGPVVTLNASPTSVASGGASTLSWTVSGSVSSCTASGSSSWSGAKSTAGGGQTISGITTDLTFTLSCSGPGGTTVQSATVTVISAPSVTLTATPTSVASGGSSDLSWSTSGNISSCTASGGWSGAKSTSGGSQSVGPISSATTYTLTCSGPGGSSTDSVTVNITAGPVVTLSASPTSVSSGGSSTLGWTVSGSVSSCSASGGWSGAKSTSGGSQSSGPLSADTVFTLTCSGAGGTTSQSVTVSVLNAPVVNLSASPTSVGVGGSSNLTWTVAGNVDTCTASGGWSGAKAVTGGNQSTGSISSAATYTLTCSGPGGSSTDSVTVNITAGPVVTLTASPDTVASGGSSNLTWSVSGPVNSCTATGPSSWSGSRSITGGSQTITNITTDTTFTISCTGPGGTTVQSQIVTVTSGPSVSLVATPSSVGPSSPFELTWTVTNADSCTASGGWSGGKSNTGGNQTISGISSATTYTLTCSGAGGTRSDSVTVNITTGPIVTLSASPLSVNPGDTTNISWSVSGTVTSCSAGGGWSGAKAVTGGTQVSAPINSDTTYVLSCTGPGGTTTQNATVTVIGSTLNYPNSPTISGTATYTNTMYTFNITGTDSAGENVRYGIDWNMDGMADNWLPAPPPVAYINSGVSQPIAHSWSTAGTYTFQALTQNNISGLNSPWTSKTVTVTDPIANVNGQCGTADGHAYANGSSVFAPYTLCSTSYGTTPASVPFPAAGSSTSWTCKGSGTGVVSPACSASQNQATANVTVNVVSYGGSVSGAGIVNCTSTCSAVVTVGSSITLTATPTSSYWKFNGWDLGNSSGVCYPSGVSKSCTFVVNSSGSITITASFGARIFDYKEF